LGPLLALSSSGTNYPQILVHSRPFVDLTPRQLLELPSLLQIGVLNLQIEGQFTHRLQTHGARAMGLELATQD
jgi:hypothetical protein